MHERKSLLTQLIEGLPARVEAQASAQPPGIDQKDFLIRSLLFTGIYRLAYEEGKKERPGTLALIEYVESFNEVVGTNLEWRDVLGWITGEERPKWAKFARRIRQEWGEKDPWMYGEHD